FFDKRPHLKNTIDLLILSHPHADHIKGVSQIIDEKGNSKYVLKNLVDNGQSHKEKGYAAVQTVFRKRAESAGAEYEAVQIRRQYTGTGVTNSVIDPIRCSDIDPIITAFWGGVTNVDFTKEPYKNPNNHSVVIRVDFGQASFLFSGDLEDDAESHMRRAYEANEGLFDVDVYQVSHHGAGNDTSEKLMAMMTPKIAVISMGK
ncbi:MAG: MBL fold metallo-hydrolase, partial [Pseudomonadales bacterium]